MREPMLTSAASGSLFVNRETPKITKIRIRKGIPNPIITAFRPVDMEATTVTSSPLLYLEPSALYTSIIFILLSDVLQCPDIIQEEHAEF